MVDERKVSETCMILRIEISQWKKNIKDKEETDEVTERKGAERDSARVVKTLLPDLEPIWQEATKGRTEYYRMTLATKVKGERIVSVKAYDKLITTLRKHRDKFNELVKDAIPRLPDMIENDRERLGGLFKAGDYPNTRQFEGSFAFQIHPPKPLVIADHVLVQVSEGEREAIKREISGQLEETLKAGMRDVWGRLQKVVRHCAEKLEDDKAIFRDTLIENMRDLVNIIPSLNILDDPELEKIRKEIEGSLCMYSPAVLRGHKKVRQEVALKARGILGKIETAGSEDIETTAKIANIAEMAGKFDAVL